MVEPMREGLESATESKGRQRFEGLGYGCCDKPEASSKSG